MRLGSFPIIMIGIAISIMALSYGYFPNYVPNMKEAAMFRDHKLKLEEANKRKEAEARVAKAVELVNQAADQWRQIVLTRTPPTTVAEGGIDLGVYPWQFILDAKQYRNSIQLAVNAQVKKGGIKLPNGGPLIPDPGNDQATILAGFFNYPAVAFPVVVFDLGTITVTGTYDQIVANYESWSQMPHYIALVDGLRFTGTTPNMTGAYNVQLLGFIRAKDIFPAEPQTLLVTGAQGGARSAGGGGGGGGGRAGRGAR